MPDNSKYWQVFEDDMKIKIFLELSGEFVNTQVESENIIVKTFKLLKDVKRKVLKVES